MVKSMLYTFNSSVDVGGELNRGLLAINTCRM